jgi:hypothetical protein
MKNTFIASSIFVILFSLFSIGYGKTLEPPYSVELQCFPEIAIWSYNPHSRNKSKDFDNNRVFYALFQDGTVLKGNKLSCGQHHEYMRWAKDKFDGKVTSDSFFPVDNNLNKGEFYKDSIPVEKVDLLKESLSSFFDLEEMKKSCSRPTPMHISKVVISIKNGKEEYDHIECELLRVADKECAEVFYRNFDEMTEYIADIIEQHSIGRMQKTTSQVLEKRVVDNTKLRVKANKLRVAQHRTGLDVRFPRPYDRPDEDPIGTLYKEICPPATGSKYVVLFTLYSDGTFYWINDQEGSNKEYAFGVATKEQVEQWKNSVKDLGFISGPCSSFERKVDNYPLFTTDKIAVNFNQIRLEIESPHKIIEVDGTMILTANGKEDLSQKTVAERLLLEPECYQQFRIDWDKYLELFEGLSSSVEKIDTKYIEWKKY